MADVTLRKVIKRYDEVEAVRGIDLDIADHEFVVLVGPSGCGKSTTLRMIAGLEDITDGDIMIGGDVVNDVPPKDRDIAMGVQNYALYPHMTVAENMSVGLRLKHYPKAEAAVGRPAPARGDGPRHCQKSQGFPVRRTLVQPRRQASGPDADRNQESASEGPHHDGLRDPRPGRGDDAGRPGRGHEPRPHRADRNTQRAFLQTGHPLCRRLHRLARDEFRALPARGSRRQAAHSPDRPHRIPAAARPRGALSECRAKRKIAAGAAAGAYHRSKIASGTRSRKLRYRTGCHRTDGHGDADLFHARRRPNLRAG